MSASVQKLTGAALVMLSLLLANASYSGDWIYQAKPGDTLWDICIQYTKVQAS